LEAEEHKDVTAMILRIEATQYWRALYLMFVSLLSIILSVLSYREWLYDGASSKLGNALKVLGSLCTMYLLFMARMYQYHQRQMVKLQGRTGRRSVWSLMRHVLNGFEIGVLCMHPLPFLDGDYVFYADYRSEYHLETLLTMFVSFRVYTLVRMFRKDMEKKHKGAAAYSSAFGTHLHVHTYFFWTKYALSQDSAFFIARFILIFVLWAAFLVMISEAPVHIRRFEGEANGDEDWHHFTDYGNCVWFVIVTMTTTGYGDYSPETGTGRIVAVLAMVVGISLAAIVTALLNDRLSLSPDESRFVRTMIEAVLNKEKRMNAAKTITMLLRYHLECKRRPEDADLYKREFKKYCFEASEQRGRIKREMREKPSLKALLEDVHEAMTVTIPDKFERVTTCLDKLSKRIDRMERERTAERLASGSWRKGASNSNTSLPPLGPPSGKKQGGQGAGATAHPLHSPTLTFAGEQGAVTTLHSQTFTPPPETEGRGFA